MTFLRSQFPLRSQGFTRRQALLGAAGIGAGGVIASLLNSALPASAQLAGANLTRMATYRGWRTTWDLLVPLVAEAAFPRTLLLYDRAAGDAAVLAFDARGGVRQLRSFTDWRSSWTTIVASGFPRATGVRGLVAYDRAAGSAATFEIAASGALAELRTYSGWRKSWSSFAPIGTDGVLAYDRGAGYATLFAADNGGALREIRSYNDWRRTWDLLAGGRFVSSRDLLLYDHTARQAAGRTFSFDGELSSFANLYNWRGTWTSLHSGQFRFRGFGGSALADLLLFDQGAQEIAFVDIGANSAIASVLRAETPGTNAWTAVTPLGPDHVLFYDRATGAAALYATNRTPLPTPTPSPTRTPIPTPTPTPAIVPAERVTIRLEQVRGDATRFTANVGEPRTGVTRQGYISSVQNTSDRRIALTHRDRAGTRTGPVFLKADETSDAFDGMLVAGEWEATVSGSRSEVPPRISLDVRFELR